jgi:hypothetical protein
MARTPRTLRLDPTLPLPPYVHHDVCLVFCALCGTPATVDVEAGVLWSCSCDMVQDTPGHYAPEEGLSIWHPGPCSTCGGADTGPDRSPECPTCQPY